MFSKEYVKEVWNRDKLGGDWLGIRKNLTDNGIYPEFRLSQFYQGSTSGGIRDHAEYGGKMDYKFNVDANKLMGTWKGLYLNLHVESRWGQDIEKDVGTFGLVNTPMAYPLPGDYSGTQVTQLLVMQAFMDGRLDVFAGKLNVVDLLATLVPSTAFGQEGFMNVNSLASARPWFRFVNLSIYGAGAWWNDEKGRIKYAAFVFGQENVSTTWRIHDSFDSGVGFLGFVREYWEIGD